MQIGRLFEIVYLLLDRGSVTAGELAERFEVSVRTIHRDVEALSQAGIPVYTVRGSGGGIRLMENFVLNKLVLSQEERKGVLDALQGLRAVNVEGASQALDKLSALLGAGDDWIEVDFSAWFTGDPVSERFQTLKDAILSGRTVAFQYTGVGGGASERTVEPVKLVFRGRDWYLLAWCRKRCDYRYFKLARMGEPVAGEPFTRRHAPPSPEKQRRQAQSGELMEIVARIAPEMAFRALDEIPPEQRETQPDGGVLVRMAREENLWLYSYLMTFGAGIRVLEPERVRKKLAAILRDAAGQYPPD